MHSQLIYTLCVDVVRLAEGMGPQAIHLQYTVLECWQKRLRVGIRPKGTRTQTQCCIVLNLRNFRWFSTETVLSHDRCKLQMTTTQPNNVNRAALDKKLGCAKTIKYIHEGIYQLH